MTAPHRNGAATSINFDAQALHDAEEAEYHREEEERQQELQALLTNAFDDLSEEDELDVSHTSSRLSQHTTRSQVSQAHSLQDNATYSNSALHTDEPRMLSTWPSHQQPPLQYTAHMSSTDVTSAMTQYHHQYPHSEQLTQQHQHQVAHLHPQQHMFNGYPPQQYYMYFERGEIDGANNDDNKYNDHFDMQRADSRESSAEIIPQEVNAAQSHEEHLVTSNPPTPDSYKVQYSNRVHDSGNVAEKSGGQHEKTHRAENLDGREDRTTNNSNLQDKGSSPSVAPHPATLGGEADQQQYLLSVDGTADKRQLSQLQILYDARGRQIEELTYTLQRQTDVGDKEIRILMHKLTLASDELSGSRVSLEQSQELLAESRRRELELQGHVAGIESQIRSLETGKQQLVQKLQEAESTIETLNVELTTVGASESLSRAREQCDSLINSMKSKHEQQTLSLKEKMDEINAQLKEQVDDNNKLKKQLSNATRISESTQIERGDTINRLSRSLEESQRQCEQLLEAGTGKELAKTKHQLHESLSSNTILQDMNSALQGDIRELKEQVSLYESVSTLGIHPSGIASHTSSLKGFGKLDLQLDDSYANLGIRNMKGSQEPPDSARSMSETLSTEQTSQGLRQELERCLGMYRTKRQQVLDLQSQLEVATTDLQTTKKLLEESETQCKLKNTLEKDVDVSIENGQKSLLEAQLHREITLLKKDKTSLQKQLEEVEKHLQEVACGEEQVNQLNRELSTQMAEMVKEFDEDKQQAIESCRKACLAHHEKSKEEMLSEVEEETQKKTIEYNEQITKTQKNLDDVKDMYILVCKEKDQVEQILNKQWEARLEKEITSIKTELIKEHEVEIDQIRQSLYNNTEQKLASARQSWVLEKDAEIASRIKTGIDVARVEWFHEHQNSLELALKGAERNSENDLQQKMKQAENIWHANQAENMAKIIKKEIAAAHQKWQDGELTQALWENEAKWKSKIEDNAINEKQHRLSQQQTEETRKIEEQSQSLIKGEKEKLESGVDSMNVEHYENKCTSMERQCIEDKNRLLTEITKLEEELSVMRSKVACIEKQAKEERDEFNGKLEDSITQARKHVSQQKDEERKLAIQQIQKQNEEDYKLFLEEHQNTLNQALSTSRELANKDKTELEKMHKREVEVLLSRTNSQEDSQQMLHKIDEMERQWQVRLEEVEKTCEDEKKALMANHRLNLAQALDEAHAAWLKKLSLHVGMSEVSVLAEREQEWSEERQFFIQQLQERDELLQNADQHMEAEVAQLQRKLTLQHQQEIHHLKDQLLSNDQQQQIQNLKEQIKESSSMQTDSLKLQQVKHKYKEKFQVQQQELEICEDRVNAARQKHERLSNELLLQEQNLNKVNGLLFTAQQQLQQRQQDLKDLEHKLNEENIKLKNSISQQVSMKKQVNDAELARTAAEQQHEDLVITYNKAEEEHAEITKAYKLQHSDLTESLVKAQKQFEQLKTTARRKLANLQESMEREHSLALDKIKEKLLKQRTSQISVLEKLKRQHQEEKMELQKKISTLQESMRSTTHTPTQTEGNHMETEALRELREQYLDAINHIKADILNHSHASSGISTDQLRAAVLRERMSTAKRIRKYYLRCYAEQLEKDFDSQAKIEKLTSMHEALAHIPEKDSSVGSSRTTTPGLINMNDLTPTSHDLVPTMDDMITPRSAMLSPRIAGKPAVKCNVLQFTNGGSISPVPCSADPEEGWMTPRLSKHSPENVPSSDNATENSTTGLSRRQLIQQPKAANQNRINRPLSRQNATPTNMFDTPEMRIMEHWGNTPEITPCGVDVMSKGVLDLQPSSSTPAAQVTADKSDLESDQLYFHSNHTENADHKTYKIKTSDDPIAKNNKQKLSGEKTQSSSSNLIWSDRERSIPSSVSTKSTPVNIEFNEINPRSHGEKRQFFHEQLVRSRPCSTAVISDSLISRDFCRSADILSTESTAFSLTKKGDDPYKYTPLCTGLKNPTSPAITSAINIRTNTSSVTTAYESPASALSTVTGKHADGKITPASAGKGDKRNISDGIYQPAVRQTLQTGLLTEKFVHPSPIVQPARSVSALGSVSKSFTSVPSVDTAGTVGSSSIPRQSHPSVSYIQPSYDIRTTFRPVDQLTNKAQHPHSRPAVSMSAFTARDIMHKPVAVLARPSKSMSPESNLSNPRPLSHR